YWELVTSKGSQSDDVARDSSVLGDSSSYLSSQPLCSSPKTGLALKNSFNASISRSSPQGIRMLNSSSNFVHIISRIKTIGLALLEHMKSQYPSRIRVE